MKTKHTIDGNLRFEKKVFLPQSKIHLVRSNLIRNQFRTQHDPNYISSVYFDDINFNDLRDNIDGNPNRTKFRARFYNNQINNVRLEFKHKNTYIGSKEVFVIERHFTDISDLMQHCVNWYRSKFNKYIQPTALISYTRYYLVNNKIRATLDYNVKSKRLVGKKLIWGAQQPYGVLEFKYDKNKEMEMRKLYEKLKLPVNRITKSSKYANTLIRQ